MSFIKRSFALSTCFLALALFGIAPQHALAAPTCTLTAVRSSYSTGAAPVEFIRFDWTTTDAASFSINNGVGVVSPVASGHWIIYNNLADAYVGTATASDGTTSTCSSNAAIPVNGICGGAANTCLQGTPGNFAATNSVPPTNTWTCAGTNNGTTASCSYRASTTGGTDTSTTTSTTACTSAGITHYLYFGKTDADTGGDVTKLQLFLKSAGLLSASAPLGYYGPMTQEAVQQFQANNSIVSSGTPDTTGYGAVGPRTLAAVNGSCGGTSTGTGDTGTGTGNGDTGSTGSVDTGVTGDPNAPPVVFLKETNMVKQGKGLAINKLPSEFTIEPGTNVGLTWKSAYAKKCVASGAWDGNQNLNGTEELSPLGASQMYAITCSNDHGTTTSKLTFNVVGEPPYSLNPVETEVVSVPTQIVDPEVRRISTEVYLREATTQSNTATLPPGPVTLYWQTKNATKCTASGGWRGSVSPNTTYYQNPTINQTGSYVGSITIPNVRTSTTFKLVCIGNYAAEISDTVTVNITGTSLAALQIAERPFVTVNAEGIIYSLLHDVHHSIETIDPAQQTSTTNTYKKGVRWYVSSQVPLSSCAKSGQWSGTADLNNVFIDGNKHTFNYSLPPMTFGGYNTQGADTTAFTGLIVGKQYLYSLFCTSAGGSTNDTLLVKYGDSGPIVTSLGGASGSYATAVTNLTIIGQNFDATSVIVIDGSTTVTPTSRTSTTLAFHVPPTLSQGQHTLAVKNGDDVSAKTLTVNVIQTPSGPPSITTVLQGTGGSSRVGIIKGSNFDIPSTVQIDFSGNPAYQVNGIYSGSNNIYFDIPQALTAGAHKVKVHSALGDSNEANFTYVLGTPTSTTPPTSPSCGQTFGSCTVGTSSSVSSTVWRCTANGYVVDCRAAAGTDTSGAANNTPVNGACGTSNNTCVGGSAPTTVNSSAHTWVCGGSNGGTPAQCPSSGSVNTAVQKPTVDLRGNGSDSVALPAGGGSVKFTWTVGNSPTSCTASGAWTGSKLAQTYSTGQTLPVTPPATYTLTCTNSAGSTSDSVDVTVAGVADNTGGASGTPTVTLTAAEGSGTPADSTLTLASASGGSVKLAWTVANLGSTQCVSNIPGHSTITASGNATVPVTQNANFSIACPFGADPPASHSVTITLPTSGTGTLCPNGNTVASNCTTAPIASTNTGSTVPPTVVTAPTIATLTGTSQINGVQHALVGDSVTIDGTGFTANSKVVMTYTTIPTYVATTTPTSVSGSTRILFSPTVVGPYYVTVVESGLSSNKVQLGVSATSGGSGGGGTGVVIGGGVYGGTFGNGENDGIDHSNQG